MSYGNATHVKIASGQTVSGEVDLRGVRLLAISTPAAFTGATLAFQAAEMPTASGGVYNAVQYLNVLAAAAFVITGVAAAQHIVIDGSLLPAGVGNCMLKLVSGSAEAADRDLILFTVPA